MRKMRVRRDDSFVGYQIKVARVLNFVSKEKISFEFEHFEGRQLRCSQNFELPQQNVQLDMKFQTSQTLKLISSILCRVQLSSLTNTSKIDYSKS